MAESSFVGSVSSGSVNTASTTWYGAFGGEGALAFLHTNEAATQLKFRGSGTLKNLRVFVGTNARASSATVVTVRKAGADTTLTVSIPASTTGIVSDLSNTVTLADGDLWNYSVTTGAGTGLIRCSGVSAELETSGQAFSQLASIGSLSVTGVRYFPFGGAIGSNTSEGRAQARALTAGTLSNLQVICTANASTGFTMKSRKNGADGGQTVTIGSGLTGLFEDTSGTDTLTVGDLYNAVTSAPSAAATITSVAVKHTASTAGVSVLNTSNDGGSPLGSGVTQYNSLFGAPFQSTTEANSQYPAPFAATISKLSVSITSNASTTPVSVVLRKGGVNGNQAVTVTAGGTGVFQDLTNSDAVVAGDLIGVRSSGSDGNVSFAWMGAVVTQATSGGAAANDDLELLGVG